MIGQVVEDIPVFTGRHDGEPAMGGIKTITRLYNEMNQTKGPLANPAKDVDLSYLKEAL